MERRKTDRTSFLVFSTIVYALSWLTLASCGPSGPSGTTSGDPRDEVIKNAIKVALGGNEAETIALFQSHPDLKNQNSAGRMFGTAMLLGGLNPAGFDLSRAKNIKLKPKKMSQHDLQIGAYCLEGTFEYTGPAKLSGEAAIPEITGGGDVTACTATDKETGKPVLVNLSFIADKATRSELFKLSWAARKK